MDTPRNLYEEEVAALHADRDHPHRQQWVKLTLENSSGQKSEIALHSAIVTVQNEWIDAGDHTDPAGTKILAYRTVTVEGKPAASSASSQPTVT